jgi:DNA invertase Pin-like site-specific DNA recombinase
MLIGYARVSTDDQKTSLQLDELNKAGCEKIFQDEGYSGAKFKRPGLTNLLEHMRKGDTVVVWKLDRLGRGLRDLIELMNTFESKGIGFKSITEGIDTTTTTGRLVFHIFASLAEFERELIKERTMAGLKAARARGKLGGRPPKISPEQKEMIKKMHADITIPIDQILKTFQISKTTLYKVVKEGKIV